MCKLLRPLTAHVAALINKALLVWFRLHTNHKDNVMTVNLSNVGSGFKRSAINSNFTTIEDELNNNVFYKNNPEGRANQLENNLDMNSNDILNAENLYAKSLYLGGTLVSTTPLIDVQATRSFSSVAAMLAATDLTVNDVVETQGYYSVGDRGGNLYKIVPAGTGTADGGSYIDLATHQAQGLFPNSVFSVKQFGAVGD